MGWLREFFEKIKAAPPEQLTYAPNVAPGAAAIPGLGEPFDTDDSYVELYLESLRLSQARRFGTRFSGVVYSFVSLPREGASKAKLAAISKPSKLTELDENALDAVITVSKQLMAPTPYRGGPISLELGLFSVKTGNVISPILDYVSKVSTTAGISYVGAVAPFLPLITEGMDLIAGQQANTALEVGLDTDITLDKASVSAIIDCAHGTLNSANLSLDKDFRLLHGKEEVEHGYAVFSLRMSKTKPDYGEIPDLQEKYAAFQTALKKGNKLEAKDALTAFRLAAVASSDLTLNDAKRLAAKATDKFEAAFPPGGQAAVAPAQAREEALAEIGLYDE
jgi:hypothetical protein